jgi:hypothetical protein
MCNKFVDTCTALDKDMVCSSPIQLSIVSNVMRMVHFMHQHPFIITSTNPSVFSALLGLALLADKNGSCGVFPPFTETEDTTDESEERVDHESHKICNF